MPYSWRSDIREVPSEAWGSRPSVKEVPTKNSVNHSIILVIKCSVEVKTLYAQPTQTKTNHLTCWWHRWWDSKRMTPQINHKQMWMHPSDHLSPPPLFVPDNNCNKIEITAEKNAPFFYFLLCYGFKDNILTGRTSNVFSVISYNKPGLLYTSTPTEWQAQVNTEKKVTSNSKKNNKQREDKSQRHGRTVQTVFPQSRSPLLTFICVSAVKSLEGWWWSCSLPHRLIKRDWTPDCSLSLDNVRSQLQIFYLTDSSRARIHRDSKWLMRRLPGLLIWLQQSTKVPGGCFQLRVIVPDCSFMQASSHTAC